jgi:hypothetical protein
MTDEASYHEASGTVRFWVMHAGRLMGASVGREALHYRYRPGASGEDPLETFRLNMAEIEAIVRRRYDEGAREPVMLREHDLRVQDTPAAR